MSRIGYVYVLHFERPLAHAQHYIGCTTEPRERLITHAQGRGARIVQAALQQGIRFKLGALGTLHVTKMRSMERLAKDWHGARPFCECCVPDPKPISGCKMYPLDAISWPRWSDELARLSTGPQVIVTRMTTSDDGELRSALCAIAARNRDELGYIPDYELGLEIERGKVAVAIIDRIPVGFAVVQERMGHVRIARIVVKDAIRRCGIGRRLLQCLSARYHGECLSAAVPCDLIACEFWQGCGFDFIGQEQDLRHGRTLNIYELLTTKVKGAA